MKPGTNGPFRPPLRPCCLGEPFAEQRRIVDVQNERIVRQLAEERAATSSGCSTQRFTPITRSGPVDEGRPLRRPIAPLHPAN